jgi:hypothetical protein
MKMFAMFAMFVSLSAMADAPTCFMPGDYPSGPNGSCYNKQGFEDNLGPDSFSQVNCEEWLAGTWYSNSANCNGQGTMNPVWF